MSCGCSGRYESDDGYAEVWRDGRINRTKKDHRCCECDEIIPAGERVEATNGPLDLPLRSSLSWGTRRSKLT